MVGDILESIEHLRMKEHSQPITQNTDQADWVYGHVWDEQFAPLYFHGTALVLSPFIYTVEIIEYLEISPEFNNLYFNEYGVSIYEGLGVLIGSTILGLSSLFLNIQILKKYFSRKISLISVLSVYVGLFGIYYTFINPSLSHIPELFVVSLALFIIHNKVGIEKSNSQTKLVVLSGFIFGIAANIRIGSILLFTPVLLNYIYKKEYKTLVKLCIGFFIGIIPIFIFSQMAYGDPFETGLSLFSEKTPFGLQYFSLHNILLNPIRGLLIWSPIILLSIVGLVIGIKKKGNTKKLSIYSLLAFLAVLLFYSFWNNWWAGYSLGNRFFIVLLPVFSFGLAVVLNSIKKNQKIVMYSTFLLTLIFSTILTLGFVTFDNSNPNDPYYKKWDEAPFNMPNLPSEQYDMFTMLDAGIENFTIDPINLEYNRKGESIIQLLISRK